MPNNKIVTNKNDAFKIYVANYIIDRITPTEELLSHAMFFKTNYLKNIVAAKFYRKISPYESSVKDIYIDDLLIICKYCKIDSNTIFDEIYAKYELTHPN